MANKLLNYVAAGLGLAGLTAEKAESAISIVPTSSELIFSGLQGAVIDTSAGSFGGFNSVDNSGNIWHKANPPDTSAGTGFAGGADDAGFHSSTAYWVKDGNNVNLTRLSDGFTLDGISGSTFGVGDTIAGYVAIGNSATNSIDLRPVNDLQTIGHSIGISNDIISTYGSTFSGLGTYLADGGDANNPFHYVAGITTSTGGVIEINLGNPSDYQLVTGFGSDLTDVAYGNGNILSTSDIGDSGLAGDAQIYTHETANMLNAVPEPSSSSLIGLGGLALLLKRNRKE